MLKSMSLYQRDNKGIVKSNFVISCLTQLSLTLLHHILLLGAQFQQTLTSPKVVDQVLQKKIYFTITSPFYTIPQQGITCFLYVPSYSGTLVLWIMPPSHITVPQTIQPMEIPISQKASFVAIEVTKTTQSVHIPKGKHARVLIKLKVQFLGTRTHKHIILCSLRILDHMFDIRPKL